MQHMLMPAGILVPEIRNAIRGMVERPGGTCATVAKQLGVERTLIWRIFKGRPVSSANRALLLERLTAEGVVLEVVAHNTQHKVTGSLLHLSDVKALLSVLLHAVEAYEDPKRDPTRGG